MKKGKGLPSGRIDSPVTKFELINPRIYYEKLLSIVRSYECEAGLLGLLSENIDRPVICAHYGLNASSVAFLPDLSATRSAFKLAFDTCTPVFASRNKKESVINLMELKILYLQDCISLSAIPLEHHGRCLGVLELFSRKVEFSQDRHFHAMNATGHALADELWPPPTDGAHSVTVSRRKKWPTTDPAVFVVRDPLATLTPREMDVAGLIRGGHTSKEISSLLNISVLTVHKHRESIRKKLGLGGEKVNLASFLRRLPH